MILLSVDLGLRAKEIASIKWRMVLDEEGNLTDAIRLENISGKGLSGSVVYISEQLKSALSYFLAVRKPISTFVKVKSGNSFSAP